MICPVTALNQSWTAAVAGTVAGAGVDAAVMQAVVPCVVLSQQELAMTVIEALVPHVQLP